MKITPLDIQQMVFKVAFRGYDKDEVNRFLEDLAETVEELNRDNAVQREKIVFLEPGGGGAGRLFWGSWKDYPKVTVAGREYAEIGGRLYTQHAIERMLPSGLGTPAGA